jgi:hypothetical protein
VLGIKHQGSFVYERIFDCRRHLLGVFTSALCCGATRHERALRRRPFETRVCPGSRLPRSGKPVPRRHALNRDRPLCYITWVRT